MAAPVGANGTAAAAPSVVIDIRAGAHWTGRTHSGSGIGGSGPFLDLAIGKPFRPWFELSFGANAIHFHDSMAVDFDERVDVSYTMLHTSARAKFIARSFKLGCFGGPGLGGLFQRRTIQGDVSWDNEIAYELFIGMQYSITPHVAAAVTADTTFTNMYASTVVLAVRLTGGLTLYY
jgi:hypothetical protein